MAFIHSIAALAYSCSAHGTNAMPASTFIALAMIYCSGFVSVTRMAFPLCLRFTASSLRWLF
jgi:hypothetical protein